jgi:hypothetical protein
MIAPHKCFLTTYLLIAPFLEQIVNLREIIIIIIIIIIIKILVTLESPVDHDKLNFLTNNGFITELEERSSIQVQSQMLFSGETTDD